jgi:hypothetical protein
VLTAILEKQLPVADALDRGSIVIDGAAANNDSRAVAAAFEPLVRSDGGMCAVLMLGPQFLRLPSATESSLARCSGFHTLTQNIPGNGFRR